MPFLGLRQPSLRLRRPGRGTLWLCLGKVGPVKHLLVCVGVRVGVCVGRSAASIAHSYKPCNVQRRTHSSLSSLSCPGAYAMWMKSSTSNRNPPPRGCLYPHTRTRNFCKLCRTFVPVPGTSLSSVQRFYPYPEILKFELQCNKYSGYRYIIFIPARNFCKLFTTEQQ